MHKKSPLAIQIIQIWLILTLSSILYVLIFTFDRIFLWTALGLFTAMLGFFVWELKRRIAGKEVGIRFAVVFWLLYGLLSLWVWLGLAISETNLYAVTGFDYEKIATYVGTSGHSSAPMTQSVGSLDNLPSVVPEGYPANKLPTGQAAPQPMTKAESLVSVGTQHIGNTGWFLLVGYGLVSLVGLWAWKPARRRIFGQALIVARQEEEEKVLNDQDQYE